MDGSSFRRAQKSTRKGRLPNVVGKIGVNVAGGARTAAQEGDRTTTQEGDRTAQQEGTTTQEDSDDGWIPQQKKKHQKMDYQARDSSSSWWDWQQHNEWPGWQQWQDSDNPQSSTDPHAWTESWPASPNSGSIDPEPSVSSALSEPQSQSVTSPGSGVHRKVPRSKKGPQFQKRKWKSRKQKL